MSIYKAVIQMAIKFHGDDVAIIEAQIELPDFYQPEPHTFMIHELLDGVSHIGSVGYDAKRGKLVIAMGDGAQAPDMNREEWLEANPRWRICPDEQSVFDIHRVSHKMNFGKPKLNPGMKPKPPEEDDGTDMPPPTFDPNNN